MRRVAMIAAAIGIAMNALLPSSAAASYGLLDQQSTNLSSYPLWGSDVSLAQTFTAGFNRPLTAVAIYAAPWGTTNTAGTAARGSARIEVDPTYNGLPNTEFPLFSEETIIPLADGGQWVYFPVTPAPTLAAGTTYAITVTVHAPWGLEWLGDCANSYSGGGASVREAHGFYFLTIPQYERIWGGTGCISDFSFKTYVLAFIDPLPLPPVPIVIGTATAAPTHFPAVTPTPATTSVIAPIVAVGTPIPAAVSASPTDAQVAVAGATSAASGASGLGDVGSPGGSSGGSGGSNSSSGSSSGSPLTPAEIAAALAVLLAGGGFFLWRFRLRP